MTSVIFNYIFSYVWHFEGFIIPWSGVQAPSRIFSRTAKKYWRHKSTEHYIFWLMNHISHKFSPNFPYFCNSNVRKPGWTFLVCVKLIKLKKKTVSVSKILKSTIELKVKLSQIDSKSYQMEEPAIGLKAQRRGSSQGTSRHLPTSRGGPP